MWEEAEDLTAIRTMFEANAEATETIQEFSDTASISIWAKDGVALTQQIGIMKGYADGTFKPKKNTTRQEAAVLIYRIYKAGHQ